MTEKAEELKPDEEAAPLSDKDKEGYFESMVDKPDDDKSDEDAGDDAGDDDSGAEDGDGKTDADSEEQPGDGDEAELPEWLKAVPEDQREDPAVIAKAAADHTRELQTKLEQRINRYDALHGQFMPVQKKLSALENANKLLSEALKATGDDRAKIRTKLEAAFKKLGEDFPEDAQTMDELFSAYATSAEAEAQQARSTENERDDDEIDVKKEHQTLLTSVPSAVEISVDPRFSTYLEQNPKLKQQAKSPFSHDVIEVMDQFVEDTNWEQPMLADDFVTFDQAVASPLFQVWGQGENIDMRRVRRLDAKTKARMLFDFKSDLSLDSEGESGNDDDAGGNDGDDEGSEAIRAAKRRKRRRADKSPTPGKSSAPGGGKGKPVVGEDYFNSLIEPDE